jgi:predicted TIM-barrel fold metal-dependent hydrolase
MPRERIVDADAHIVEPKDLWARWLPARWQDKAPQLVTDEAGGDAWLFAGSSTPDPIGLVTTPGKPFDEFRWTGVTYDDARPGCYDGAARLEDMDADGIDAAVIFPPQRMIGHFLGDEDEDFVRAGVQAYNDFLFDEFCAPDPARLVGMAQIPSTGIDDACDTLRKARARGFTGVVLGGWPAGGETITDDDDEFWAAAVDEAMPVTIHIFMSSRQARIKARQAATAAGGEAFYGGKTSRANAKAVGGLGGIFATVPSTIGQLIFTGTFERFPELRVALIETGVGWIPHLLEQLDDRYWRNRSWGEIPLSEPPSFYWFRNLAAAFVYDPIGVALRDHVGVDNMLWSSDYPHHVNDWPYSRRVINQELAGVPQVDRAKILAGNAARIFGLTS